jgi:hypothetical protein
MRRIGIVASGSTVLDAGAFFFVNATSVFLVSSPSAGFFFFWHKTSLYRKCGFGDLFLTLSVIVKF